MRFRVIRPWAMRSNKERSKKRLVRCAMIGDLRIPVPAPVGPKLREHLEVFVNHLSERAPQELVCFR